MFMSRAVRRVHAGTRRKVRRRRGMKMCAERGVKNRWIHARGRTGNPHEVFSPASLRTSPALLSERSPRNAACLRRPSAVHSTNRICAASSGLTHSISRISPAVTPPPQRDDFGFGRSTEGLVQVRLVLSLIEFLDRRKRRPLGLLQPGGGFLCAADARSRFPRASLTSSASVHPRRTSSARR